MAVDKSVIAAMEKAVETEPENKSLRLHLVSLLIEDKQFEKALNQAQTVLGQEPTNLDALEKAALSAEKLGDAGKAGGYRKLLDALKEPVRDRKSTRLNSSHGYISYAVFCLK